jgi:hypothetical protein
MKKENQLSLCGKPEVHPENAFEWLNKCDFINCENHYLSSNYINYHLTQIYGKAVEFESPDFKLPQIEIDEFYKITDLSSMTIF